MEAKPSKAIHKRSPPLPVKYSESLIITVLPFANQLTFVVYTFS